MRTLGVGIVGVGDVAGAHIAAILKTPGLRVAALMSRRRESAEAAKARFGLDAAIVESFDDLLLQPGVDIVDICAPHPLHADFGIGAARAGKHIIMEKPAAMDLEELRSLREEVERSRVAFLCCLECRFNPHVKNIMRLIENGGVGTPFYLESSYYHKLTDAWNGWNWGVHQRSGGPSCSLVGACHAIDLLLYMAQSDPIEVFAYGCHGHRGDFEYEPTVSALVKFANGAVGKTGASFEVESPYLFNLLVHGPGGTVHNEKYYSRGLFPGQAGWQEFNTTFLDSGAVDHHPFQDMMQDMAEAIRDKRPPLVNMRETWHTHQVCLAIDQSLASGKPVPLPL